MSPSLATMLAAMATLLCLIRSTRGQVVVVGGRHGNYTTGQLERELMAPSIVDIECRASIMCVTISRKWLKNRWNVTNHKSLSLIQSCDQSKRYNASHVTLCTEAYQLTTCGTTFSVNDSHVIYSNNVSVVSRSSDDVTPTYRRTLPWKCVYPVKLLVGVQFVPLISPITEFLGGQSGQGVFQAAMFLYQDPGYTSIYETSPTLQMDDRIRVRVQLVKGPASSKLQAVRCWATPQPLDGATEQTVYELLNDFCPSPNSLSADVTMVSNGEFKHSTWESKVFRFVGFPNIFLHCSVKVCFENCLKTCVGDSPTARSRRKREVNNVIVSLGPLRTGSDVPTVGTAPQAVEVITQPNRKRARKNYLLGLPRQAVYAIIASLIAATLLMTSLAVACVIRRSKQRRKMNMTSSGGGEVTTGVRAISGTFAPPASVAMTTG